MIYPVLTYSRNLGDFAHALPTLHQHGLKAIRLIYKGKSEEEFNARIREIQEQIAEHKLELDILIDLPGKKPLAGSLAGGGLNVEAGKIYSIAEEGTELSFPFIPTANFFDHSEFPNLEAGDIISFADDELNISVKEVSPKLISCEALNSFYLTSNRSLSVKNKAFSVAANSEKDMAFVQNLKDIPGNVKLLVSFTKEAADLRKLQLLHPEADVIPKIETILDDATLLEIMDCCETIMLGRGDLSLASKANEIFKFQEHLIGLCKTHNKKLIIGTGLLTGIGDKGSPSISEVMDYSYLRDRGIEGFLITGSNALTHPLQTLEFIRNFEL